jgi:hypothetical protein
MTWPSPLRHVLYAAFSLESVTDEHAGGKDREPDLRRSVLAIGKEPGRIKHCRSVIMQRGKKTTGSQHAAVVVS